MHPRPPVRAARRVEDVLDPLPELGVRARSRGEDVLVPFVEGGPGDLEQLTRPFHRVVLLNLLRLDEREHVHRVSLAKKAVARLRISTSWLSRRFSRRSSASSSRSLVVRPSTCPSSTSACFTQARTAVSVRSRSRATLATELPGWRTSATTSALNSLVNDRRRRAFLRPIVSIMLDILSGAKPPIVDVRQTRSSPLLLRSGLRTLGWSRDLLEWE